LALDVQLINLRHQQLHHIRRDRSITVNITQRVIDTTVVFFLILLTVSFFFHKINQQIQDSSTKCL